MRCDTPFYNQIVRHIQKRLPKQRITRIQNLAYLTAGIIKARSVSLSKIAQRIPLPIHLPSVIQRLWRLLDNDRLDPVSWYHPFIKPVLSGLKGKTIVLVMDRSYIRNWHNILWIGICWKGRALPLCWLHLGHVQGNSNFSQQQTILKRILPLLPKDTQVILLADREFQSVKLMSYLSSRSIDYVIRLKSNVHFTTSGGQHQQLKALDLLARRRQDFQKVQLTKNQKLLSNLVAFWDPCPKKRKKKTDEDEDLEPWFLATSLTPSAFVVQCYRKRFGIEAMFSDTKSRGFELNHTHLENPKRIERLLLALAIACLWMVLTGQKVIKYGLRRILESTRKRRSSIFQLGLKWFQRQYTLLLSSNISCRLLMAKL